MYKHIQTLYQTLQHVQKYTSLQKYTTNLQTYTKQSSTTFYRIVNISLQLYTNIHKYTQLNKCLQHFFTKLYTTLQNNIQNIWTYTKLYKILQHFFKIAHNSIKLYTNKTNRDIHKFPIVYNTLHTCTHFYKAIHKHTNNNNKL
jgi:hypothetical protein